MRRMLLWFFAFIGFAFCSLMGVMCIGVTQSFIPQPQGVLYVSLDGPLPERVEAPWLEALAGGPALGAADLHHALERAALDDNIKGVVLDVKQGGLGLAQIQDLNERFDQLREAGKWTAAFLETAGEFSQGDGAYGIAVVADEVTLAPPGQVRLQGLEAQVPFFRDMFERLEIEPHFSQRHEFKNSPNSFLHKGFTPEHRQATKALLDDLQGVFNAHIAARRGTAPPKVSAWVKHGPYNALEAQKAGMVDHIGYWDTVHAKAVERAGNEEPWVALADYLLFLAQESEPEGRRVAVVHASGPIMRGQSSPGGSDQSGSDTVTRALRAARADGVDGVILRVDSPGGSYVASDIIRREVELTREAGIPVVASMGNVAASGGYFVAMHADAVVAQTGTVTGSIGVYAGTFAMRRFFKRWLGIQFDSYRPIDNPGALSWLDPPNREGQAQLDAGLDEIYADFVKKAAEGRKMPPQKMESLARGRVWSGLAAHAKGLVDDLGGMEKAKTLLREKASIADDELLTLVTYPRPKTPVEMIQDIISGRGEPMGIRWLWQQAWAGLQTAVQAETVKASVPRIELSGAAMP